MYWIRHQETSALVPTLPLTFLYPSRNTAYKKGIYKKGIFYSKKIFGRIKSY